MRLTISTPLSVIVDVDDVAHLRAEDETGAFGILRGHAEFLSVLAASVVTWRDDKGQEHHCAVRGGMLEVRNGQAITIASREAVQSDDLHHLETEVLVQFQTRLEEEKSARADSQRLYLAAIRQICRFLRSERGPAIPGGPGLAPSDDGAL